MTGEVPQALLIKGLQDVLCKRFDDRGVRVSHGINTIRRRNEFTARLSSGEVMKAFLPLDPLGRPVCYWDIRWIRKTSKRTMAGMASNLAALGARS